MDPRYGDPMPRFPLYPAPLCKICQQPCNRESRGQRYCYCCPCPGSNRKSNWCTWDDAKGVQPGNPLCDCGLYCRVDEKKSGETFETCAIGRCNMSTHKGQSQRYSFSARDPSTSALQGSIVAGPSFIQAASGPYTQPYAHPSSIYANAHPSSTYPNAHPSSTYANAYPSSTYANVYPSSTYANEHPSSTYANAYPSSNYAYTYPSSTYAYAHPSSSYGYPPPILPEAFRSNVIIPRPPNPPAMKIDNEFVRLLDHVMGAAGRAKFPSRVIDMSNMMKALPDIMGTGPGKSPPGPFRIFSSTDFERHSKVGAAGELFIFSLLNRVLENKVYIEDWKSNMRNLVKQHPSFRGIPDWTGSETADIVFPDDHGALTNLLIESGYLDYDKWYGRRPEYLIEVKSSLSNKNKEFYLSSDQYQRMQEHSTILPYSTSRPKIYIIARASNLQDWDIDLRLYVNPGSLKDTKLRFRQVWAVEDLGN